MTDLDVSPADSAPEPEPEPEPASTDRRVWYIYPPAGGPGLGRYWRAVELGREWTALGYDPLVISPGYWHMRQVSESLKGYMDVGGVRHLFLPMKPYSSRALSRVLGMARLPVDLLVDRNVRQEGRCRPPATIIYSSPYLFGVVGAWWLARRFKSKFIVEIRDLWPLSVTELLKTPSWHPFVVLLAGLERFAHSASDHVVSLLRNAEPYMRQHGLRAGKFTYIPNGVRASAESGAKASPLGKRIAALKAQGRFVVVHGGNMSESTPLEGLIRAIARLDSNGASRVHLVIFGRGDMEAGLRLLASTIAPLTVEFHPQVEREEALDAYRHADLGFSSSHDLPLYRFGISPNKVFDYMLEALPVLLANVKGSTHFEGAEGVLTCDLVDIDAMAESIEEFSHRSPDERRAMGLANRSWVLTHHSYEILATRYASLFRRKPDRDRAADVSASRHALR